MKRVVGVGRVVEGKIVYTGEHGGFVRPVKREVAPVEVKQEEVELAFRFKSNTNALVRGEVVHVDFQEEEQDRINAAIDRMCEKVAVPVVKAGKKIEKVAGRLMEPLNRYFFDGEDIKDVLRKAE